MKFLEDDEKTVVAVPTTLSRGLFLKPICSGVVLVKLSLVWCFIAFFKNEKKYKNLGQQCTFFEVQSLDTC